MECSFPVDAVLCDTEVGSVLRQRCPIDKLVKFTTTSDDQVLYDPSVTKPFTNGNLSPGTYLKYSK